MAYGSWQSAAARTAHSPHRRPANGTTHHGERIGFRPPPTCAGESAFVIASTSAVGLVRRKHAPAGRPGDQGEAVGVRARSAGDPGRHRDRRVSPARSRRHGHVVVAGRRRPPLPFVTPGSAVGQRRTGSPRARLDSPRARRRGRVERGGRRLLGSGIARPRRPAGFRRAQPRPHARRGPIATRGGSTDTSRTGGTAAASSAMARRQNRAKRSSLGRRAPARGRADNATRRARRKRSPRRRRGAPRTTTGSLGLGGRERSAAGRRLSSRSANSEAISPPPSGTGVSSARVERAARRSTRVASGRPLDRE